MVVIRVGPVDDAELANPGQATIFPLYLSGRWCKMQTLEGLMSDENNKYDVFLSYSMKDRDWVGSFVDALRADGIRTCFGMEDFEPGSRWDDELQDALRTSRALVVILSPNNTDNLWTCFEVGAAVAGQKRIISVLTGNLDAHLIPPLLRRYPFFRESSAVAAGRRVAEMVADVRSTERLTSVPAAREV